ncbi:MAG: phosphoribosylamine--glycine ligase, partial [Cytophagaceae bacterium]|nr:phosphoribosylamine--glycine ligase [Cytophagaceae bacterium]
MNILLIGSGGREHALAWKIKQSPRCQTIFIAPGNAGTAEVGQNVNIDMNDFPSLGNFCIENKIDLVLVGPEAPLVNGIRDYFETDATLAHILFVGPGKKGAQLEGSKDFSKQFMERHGIPTAASETFTDREIEAAKAYIKHHSLPIVLKADGLAAGKGVIIAESLKEAEKALDDILADKKFGDAGAKVVIEQFLRGIEMSSFVLTDGKNYVMLPDAKDYKRIGEKDTGLNTGGMGAVSPVPFAQGDFMRKVEQRIVIPTIEGLEKDNIPYVGFVFIGLMNVEGEPYVIEYNARLGDPETEVIIPRIASDLVDLLELAGQKKLNEAKITLNPKTATTVVLVAGGYPEEYAKGDVITAIDQT